MTGISLQRLIALFLTAALSALIVTTAASAQGPEPRQVEGDGTGGSIHIIGGTPAPEDEYPFMVFVEHDFGSFYWCAGTLIAPTVVLTAAHCVYNFTIAEARVWVGADHLVDDYGEEIDVVGFITHPDYDGNTTNDLAVIILAEPSQRQPVRLASTAHAGLSVGGAPTTAVGWGWQNIVDETIVNDLTHVTLPVVDDTTCASQLFGAVPGSTVVPATMVCAGSPGLDICLGDSGGPLLAVDSVGRYVQVGITSWIADCGVTPSVFTEVAAFSDWLNQFVEADGDVNISGHLESGDALAVLASITQNDPGLYDEPQGDLSGDGATDLLDALMLARAAQGIVE